MVQPQSHLCVYMHIFYVFVNSSKVKRTPEHILALVSSPIQDTVKLHTTTVVSVRQVMFQQPPTGMVPSRTYPNSTEINNSVSSDLIKFCATSMMKLSNNLPPPL